MKRQSGKEIMIRTRILLFLILIPVVSYSQIVTTIPEFPTQNDSIIVIFDATQTGAEELLNYTGTVYAHTGVTLDSLGVIKDWQWVIAPWNTNLSKAALTRISTNLYKLNINLPRQYYHVTNSDVKIIKLDFVFRSSDETKQTRPDIFVDLYEQGLNVVINNPQVPDVNYGDPLRAPVFIRQFNSIDIKVSAITIGTKISSLSLFVDQNQVAQSTVDSLDYTFNYSDYSRFGRYFLLRKLFTRQQIC